MYTAENIYDMRLVEKSWWYRVVFDSAAATTNTSFYIQICIFDILKNECQIICEFK